MILGMWLGGVVGFSCVLLVFKLVELLEHLKRRRKLRERMSFYTGKRDE